MSCYMSMKSSYENVDQYNLIVCCIIVKLKLNVELVC